MDLLDKDFQSTILNIFKKQINNMWYTHTHTQWNTIQPLKRLKSAKCNNMNATCGYYAKYSKIDGERQMPYDSLICEHTVV